jgi:hypothetical protein
MEYAEFTCDFKKLNSSIASGLGELVSDMNLIPKPVAKFRF